MLNLNIVRYVLVVCLFQNMLHKSLLLILFQWLRSLQTMFVSALSVTISVKSSRPYSLGVHALDLDHCHQTRSSQDLTMSLNRKSKYFWNDVYLMDKILLDCIFFMIQYMITLASLLCNLLWSINGRQTVMDKFVE